MAEVFEFVGGEEIERVIARQSDVQKALKKHLAKSYIKAEADLKANHTETGNAYISWSKGDIDYYLELNDPPGFLWDGGKKGQFMPSAALAIEIRLQILARATGLRGE